MVATAAVNIANPPAPSHCEERLSARLRLLSRALGVAAGRLAANGCFAPFGLAVTLAGDMVELAALPSDATSGAEELIGLLQRGLEAGRRTRRYAATALAFESEIPVTGGAAAIRAVELRLCDESSAATVCFPHLRERGRVCFEWPHWRGEVASAAEL